MSVRRWVFALALAGLVAASVALAAPEGRRPAAPEATGRDTLTPQDQAAVQELRDLWKQAHIAGLELRLAEAKGAPEGDVAAKRKAVEEARDRMRQWRADHPGLARQMHRRGGGRGLGRRGGGARHRGGMGMRGGRGLGPGGMGMRGGRGLGPGGMGMRGGRGLGPGGMGMRGGRGPRGMMGGRGERMRLRQRDPSQCPYVQAAPDAAPKERPEETQPE